MGRFFFFNNMFINLKNMNIVNFEFGKDGARTNDEDPSEKFLEILNMGSTSSRKHEMEKSQ